MRKIIAILAFIACLTLSASQAPVPVKSPQVIYIEQFAALAVTEMYRSGVPASITLAQGLLESGYGLSELAVKGNNHFGIKCHNNWDGGRMYYDDDKRGECFRKYSSPEQSYRDHSDFLRYRERYSFLFDYRITDYKAWAYGLKKAGYATDPAYPKKLIKLIEDYRLYEYDTKPAAFAGQAADSGKKRSKTERKAAVNAVVPESPSQIGRVQPLTQEQRNDFSFSVSREMFSQNGVPFVYASEGETYQTIAASNNLFLRELLKFNDLKRDVPLEPGTVVYLQAKKKQAVKGLDKHVMEEGETMREISQRYAVRLKSLYKMNGMTDLDVPREGDIIKLRK